MHKELLILGLLQQQSLSGYDLHRILQFHGELYTDLKKANLYYLLERMAKDGFLEVEAQAGARGPRGERLLYTLTKNGRNQLQQLLHEVLLNYEPVHSGVEVAVVLLTELTQVEALDLLRKRKQLVEQRRIKVKAELGNFSNRNLLTGLAADHLLNLIDAELSWIERSLQLLQDGEWPAESWGSNSLALRAALFANEQPLKVKENTE